MLKKRLFLTLLSTFLIVIISIGISFAWYTNKKVDDFESPDVTGYSTAAYYAGGDGSAEKPFLIKNSRHLYNFAWLQYLGTYNKIENGSVKQYYFEVIDDIDCEGLVLPPIGTTDNPFLGNFNGGNHTIENVTFSNNYNDLKKKPSSINSTTKFKGCEIIGFFGVVGKYADYLNVNISSQVNSVYNFTIDGVQINNACTNTLAGLIAGFVNGNISNVGVHYGKINLQAATSKISSFKNISSYTLIGDYDEALVSWEDKPSSENQSGDGASYGGSLNFLEMVTRMGYMNSNGWTIPSINYNPEKDKSSHPNSGNYLSLIVDNEISNSYYSKNSNESIPKDNIGVITGQDAKILAKATAANVLASDMYVLDSSGNKVHPSKLTYLDSGSTSDTKYIYSTQIVDADIYTKDFTSGNDKPGDVLVTNLDKNIKEDIINILSDDSQMLYGMRFSGQIEGNNWLEIQNIYIAGHKRNITVPPKAIWFAAQESGFAKIIFGAYNGATQGIGVYRIERTVSDGTEENRFFTELSNRKVNTEGNATATGGGQNIELTHLDSAYSNVMSDGSIKYTYNSPDSSAVSSTCIWRYTGYRDNVTKDRLYYVEFPLIAGYEYAFGDTNSGGGMILYMDIGQNGINGDTPAVKPEIKDSAIEGIDFVYLNHSNNTFSSTSDDYSNVFFQISGTTTSIIDLFFRRNNDDDDNYAGSEGIVLFLPKNSLGEEWTTTSSGKTDGDLSLDWSYAGTKGLSGTSTKYPNAEQCEVLSGNKVSGGLANTNTGANTKRTITYYYRRRKEDGTYESVQITKGTVTNGYAITKPDFEIAGYEVVKWYTDEALTQEYDFSKAVTENLVLYASVTEVETFTVSFMDGTKELQTLVVNSGSYANPAIPRKEGYVFSHWADASGNKVDLTTTAISADTVLTAVWLDAHDIKFVYNIGGDDVVISTLEVIDDDQTKITKPEDPTLDGYNFEGWYTTKDYTTEFNFDTAPQADTTIYAKFVAIQYYDVVFGYMDGETLVTIMQDKVEEKTSVQKPADPTRVGYVFGGWYSDSTCETEFDFSSEITVNTTIYAKWQASLVVSFEYEDGTTIDSISVLSGNTITATSIVPAKDGYRFDGNWYIKASDGTVSGTAFDFADPIEANTILVPGWIKTYEVTIVYGNGTNNSTEVVDIDTVYTKPEDPTRTGYKFNGWYTLAQDGTKTNYDFSSKITSDITIYADWVELVNVTIIIGDSIDVIYGESGDTITLPSTNDDYYIISWTDGISTYQPGDQVTVTTTTTYTADVVNKYTVTVNDGTSITTLVSDVNSKVTLPDEPENSTTATFAGWTDGTTTYSAGQEITVNSDMTITATWSYVTSVTFDANGGTIGSDATVLVENIQSTAGIVDTSKIPADPTRDGYTFQGWYIDSACTIELDTSKPITVSTIYAGWEAEAAYTTTFYADGGTFSNGSSQLVVNVRGNGTVIMPEIPTRDGYVFDCWYVKQYNYSANDTVLTETTVIPEGYNVYASWIQSTKIEIEISLFKDDSYASDLNSAFINEAYIETIDYMSVTIPVSGSVKKYLPSQEEVIDYVLTNYGGKYGTATFVDWYIANPSWNSSWVGDYYDIETGLHKDGNNGYPINSGYNVIRVGVVVSEKQGENYIVEFNSNGGSIVANQTVLEGRTATKPTDPTRDGYIFSGWYSDSSLTTEYNFSSPISGNITLYAKWIEEKTVTINYVEGGNTTTEYIKVAVGESITLPSDVTNEYYITSITSGETSYNEGSSPVIASDITFNVYKVTIYQVTIDYGNGTTETLYTNENYLISPSNQNPTNGTAELVGWYVGDTAIDFETYEIKSSGITITAKWEYNVTVTFSVDGSTYYEETTTTGYITLPENPSKEGYIFLGWYNGSEKIDGTTMFSVDTTVTAEWQEIYTITFVYNDNSTTDLVLDTNEDCKITNFPVNPTRDGYAFVEWNTASDDTGNTVTTDTVFESDTTVYAIWKEQTSISVTFSYSTASGFTPAVSQVQVTANEDGTITIPKYYDGYYYASDIADAYDSNKIIVGWKISGTDTVINSDPRTMRYVDGTEYRVKIPAEGITDGATLEAVWSDTSLVSVYMDLGGSGNSLGDAYYIVQNVYNVNEALGYADPLVYPTKPGYTFSGWNDAWSQSSHYTSLSGYTQNGSGNAYFHAKFTKDSNVESQYFAENGITSSFFTINGNTSNSKGSVDYNGWTYKICLKMESSTEITFTPTSSGTVTLVFGSDAAGKIVKIDGDKKEVDSNGIYTFDVSAGTTYTITKGDTINLFYMEVEYDS